jgi:hypothetical protein
MEKSMQLLQTQIEPKTFINLLWAFTKLGFTVDTTVVDKTIIE